AFQANPIAYLEWRWIAGCGMQGQGICPNAGRLRTFGVIRGLAPYPSGFAKALKRTRKLLTSLSFSFAFQANPVAFPEARWMAGSVSAKTRFTLLPRNDAVGDARSRNRLGRKALAHVRVIPAYPLIFMKIL